MSIGLEIYAVDYEKVRAAYGSNDRALYQAVMDASDFESEDNSVTRDPEYRDQEWANESPLYKDILNEFLAGKINVEQALDSEYSYVRVLHEICAHYGELLDAKIFERLPNRMYFQMLNEFFQDHGVDSQFESSGILLFETDPIGLQLGSEDTSHSFLSSRTVSTILQKIEPLNLMGVHNDVATGIVVVHSWLTHAEKSKRGLMISCG